MTSLTAVNTGTFECVEIHGDNEAQVRLKRLGVCEGRQVEVVRAGDPMILSAVGARIGISKALAACVQVVPSNLLARATGTAEPSHG